MCSPQKVLCFFCTGIFLIHTAFSQTILIPYRDKNLWGFADTNGNIRITPAYDRVNFFNFSKPVTKVRKDKKVSLLDTSGKLLLPFSDHFEPFSKNYLITQNKKKGIYSSMGKALVPCEYDGFEWKDSNQVIGLKDNQYYLVSYKTGKATKMPPPKREPIPEGTEMLIPVEYDEDNITSVPNPQLPASDFPRLKTYKDLVHIETIWKNRKPVFHIFQIIKDRKILGFVGENGVQFFKD